MDGPVSAGAQSVTAQRAQDGTTAAAWASGAIIEARLTRASLNAMTQPDVAMAERRWTVGSAPSVPPGTNEAKGFIYNVLGRPFEALQDALGNTNRQGITLHAPSVLTHCVSIAEPVSNAAALSGYGSMGLGQSTPNGTATTGVAGPT